MKKNQLIIALSIPAFANSSSSMSFVNDRTDLYISKP